VSREADNKSSTDSQKESENILRPFPKLSEEKRRRWLREAAAVAKWEKSRRPQVTVNSSLPAITHGLNAPQN
jgi:hypothetical protein